MQIRCGKCQTVYELDATLLPPEGAPVQCTKCQNVFTAKPALAPPARVREERAAPAMAASGPDSTVRFHAAPAERSVDRTLQFGSAGGVATGPNATMQGVVKFNPPVQPAPQHGDVASTIRMRAPTPVPATVASAPREPTPPSAPRAPIPPPVVSPGAAGKDTVKSVVEPKRVEAEEHTFLKDARELVHDDADTSASGKIWLGILAALVLTLLAAWYWLT